DQFRVMGCEYKIAALTNITPEHLDYHKSFERYSKAKLSLINNADMAVVNTDCSTFYRYKKMVRGSKVWYSSIEKSADFTWTELRKQGVFNTFPGFERKNMVVAYGVCKLLGLSSKKISSALNTYIRVKGRFDFFVRKNRQFLVDFAHTPYAFKELYDAITSTLPYERIIHVFGCAGLRDHLKRPMMGEVAGLHADYIIFTEEDYRTEDINTILTDVEVGIKKNKKQVKDKTYFLVPDRYTAIETAVKMATKKDLIVLTGKAHEKSLCRGTAEHPWDEYAAVEDIMGKNS
ncbi:MAG: cyanophycin synthetase, partial [Patescibacteria group bacterium]